MNQNTAKSGTEVFIGGLAATVTENKIHEVFSTCGEILEIRLIKDHNGHLKGYGFVRFATKEAADKAVKEKAECLVDGKNIGVLPSTEQDTLFLGNLPKGWNAEEFEKFVRQIFPDVVSVDLVMLGDVKPGQDLQNRGHGFVKFSSHAAAARAYRAGSVPNFVLAGNVHPSIKWAEEEPKIDPKELAKIKIAFARDLPITADEDFMKKLFEPFGKVDKVILHRKGNWQIGFIYFDKRQDLDNALKEMNGKVVQGPQGGTPFQLQIELARPMDKKRKRAHEDVPSKPPTILQSQSILPQNYLRIHSSGVPATIIQKELRHVDSYENYVAALPLAVRERLLRILRLDIASRSDIDVDCLFLLKELPESTAISVLDQFMLSGAEMLDKGVFLVGLMSKHLVNRDRLGQLPLSLSREVSTLSREPVHSTLYRPTHLPDYMVNNTSLSSNFGPTDSRPDMYTSRYSGFQPNNYLSSHSMFGRMKDGGTSDTSLDFIGNARGYPRIGLHSPQASDSRNLSSLHPIPSSAVDTVRNGLNSRIDGPAYESVSPFRMIPTRSSSHDRVNLTYDAAAAGRRTTEVAPTSVVSYSRVATHLDEPIIAINQAPRHRARFDPFTGEPYRFDPFTGKPILPENSSRHN